MPRRASGSRLRSARLDTGRTARLRRLATGRAGSIGLVMPIARRHRILTCISANSSAGLGDEAVRHDFPFRHQSERVRKTRSATCRRLAASGNVDALFLAYVRANDPRIAMLKIADDARSSCTAGRSAVPADYPVSRHRQHRRLLRCDAAARAARPPAARADQRTGLSRLLDPPHEGHASGRWKNTACSLDATPACSTSLMTDEHGHRAMQQLSRARSAADRRACAPVRCSRLAPSGPLTGQDCSWASTFRCIAHDDVLPMLKPENFMRAADDDPLVASQPPASGSPRRLISPTSSTTR